MGYVVSDSLVWSAPSPEVRHLGDPCAKRPNTVVHPCREEQSIDSRVHGNRTLYATIRIYYYKLLLINCTVPIILPRREVEEGFSEVLILITIINLLLYNAAATSAALLFMLYVNCLNCWLFSSCA